MNLAFMRRAMSFGPVAGAFFLIVLGGCAGKRAPQGERPASIVHAAVAVRGTISTSLSFEGQVSPLLSSTLSSPQSGNLVSVYVNEGDHVRQGSLLAKIDDSQLRAQLDQAQGQATSADGKLQSSAVMQPIQSTQYGSTLGEAQARVSADRAALASAALVYNGNAKLYPQGYIAQTALEQSRSAEVAAQQQLYQDQAALRAAKSSLRQEQADLQNVAAARGTLEQARGLVEQIRTEIAQTAVYAPFDGVVTARLLDPGAFAGPNQPIVTVSHLDTIYVNADVPDDAVPYMHPGMRMTFTTPTYPGKTFSGKLFDLNAIPTAGTLSYRARIRYANADGSLRGGMLVTVIASKERRSNVVIVPRTAVFQADAGSAVFVVKDGNAEQVPVRVGLQTETTAEIRGVEPGTQVVTSRPDALQNGARVVVAVQD